MRPPPGYPFAGDIPARPPEPDPDGASSRAPDNPLAPLGVALMFAGAMMGVGFLLVAFLAQGRHVLLSPRALPAHPRVAPDDLMGDSIESALAPRSSAGGELVTPREVPVYPARVLEGCSTEDLALLEEGISMAVAHGAPLCGSDGDMAACVDVYEHSARVLAASLPASCAGPTRALELGASVTGARATPDAAQARAAALRSAFDGLMEALDRSRAGGATSL